MKHTIRQTSPKVQRSFPSKLAKVGLFGLSSALALGLTAYAQAQYPSSHSNPAQVASYPDYNNSQQNPDFAPPSRVGRVSYSSGRIHFLDAGGQRWGELTPNRPISTGDSISIPDTGRAELHVGSHALRLHERTQIQLANLSDEDTQIQLSQGTVIVRVRKLHHGETLSVITPNLLFYVEEPGEYRLTYNPDHTTQVYVRNGKGVAQGSRENITLRNGEYTRFSGSNLQHNTISRGSFADNFDQWSMERDRLEDNSVSARYVSRDVIGYQQLDEYGSWDNHAEYGAVWYPRSVTASWAPYRDGQWMWVAPWGWTWVDRAPWGFAPYHYGRWAYIGHRWGWVPGRFERHTRAVYAPALVAFVGWNNGNTSTSISFSSGSGLGASVSWFPLGPGEVYRPYYTTNRRYIEYINTPYVQNTTIINNQTNIYVNGRYSHGITSIPYDNFRRGDYAQQYHREREGDILGSQIRKMRNATEANAMIATGLPSNIQPDNNNRYGNARPSFFANRHREDAVMGGGGTPNTISNTTPAAMNINRGNENRGNHNRVLNNEIGVNERAVNERITNERVTNERANTPVQNNSTGLNLPTQTHPVNPTQAPQNYRTEQQQRRRDMIENEGTSRNERYIGRSDTPRSEMRVERAEPSHTIQPNQGIRVERIEPTRNNGWDRSERAEIREHRQERPQQVIQATIPVSPPARMEAPRVERAERQEPRMETSRQNKAESNTERKRGKYEIE